MSFGFLLVALLAGQLYAEQTNERAVEALRLSLERGLPGFSLQTRRHYATRMYRLTGDSDYIALIVPGAVEMAESLRRDVLNWSDSAYCNQRVVELLGRYDRKTRKGRLRHDYFKNYPRFLLADELLNQCHQISEYGLADSEEYRVAQQKALELLQGYDFQRDLLAPELIRIYSAQVANRVFDLHFLGIADLRAAFVDSLQRCFPDSMDDELSHAEFEDKLYGLTHIVIAASGYYQSFAFDAQSLKVIDYFSDNLDAILAEARPDIVAEVGLCFLISNSNRHSAVEECRHHLVSLIDENTSMIPATDGDDDIEEGEHRNVLALMLLMWDGRLHTGPQVRDQLPTQH